MSRETQMTEVRHIAATTGSYHIPVQKVSGVQFSTLHRRRSEE
jgi:hypothetical protein